MTNYLQLLELLAPVFLLIALGLALRRVGILKEEAEQSILNLVIRIFYPALIFKAVLASSSLKDPSNVLVSPIAGLFCMAIGLVVGFIAAKVIGFEKGAGLRTFCFSVAVFNYGYIPIPIVEGLYGNDVLAVLFVFNVGVELGIWTLGVTFVSGASFRDFAGKIFNPTVFALLIAVLLNVSGGSGFIPEFVLKTVWAISSCAIPVGLIVIGATLNEFFEKKDRIFDLKTSIASVVLRLGVLPVVMLALAAVFPFSDELKKVLVIQSAMPAGIMPIALAKHYSGQPLVAFRVVVATTLASLLAIPLWIRFGSWFVFGSS